MTKKLILALYILLAAASHAQESNSVFNFLEIEVCTMRGKKCRAGDVVELDGQSVTIGQGQ